MLARYDCLVIVRFFFFCSWTTFYIGRQKACSCYTIEDGSPTEMTWPQARSSCEYYNKSLVAMETLQEWEFITKTIKGQTSGEYNEWHIGLLKNSTTGNWTWINGRPLTIDKWRDYKPLKNDLFALIAREFPPGSYGSFNSIKGGVRRGWICEEKTGVIMLGYRYNINCPLT